MFKNLKILSEKYKEQKTIKLLNYLVFLLAIYYLWKKLEIYELEKVRLLSTYSLLAAVFLIFISFFSIPSSGISFINLDGKASIQSP